MLQGCLNGDRMRAFHPAVPCTPEELARDAQLAVAAGADELHVHPRAEDDRQSLQPFHVAGALSALRDRVPDIPVGISTLWSIPPVGRARHEHIRQWEVLPDYVSVNLVEEDAVEVIRLVLDKGIGVEAGLSSLDDAKRFISLPEAGRCLRVLIEIDEQDVEQGMQVARGIMEVLARAKIGLPLLLHGYEATMWPLYREAVHRGLDGRIGLEDGALLPSGERAKDNADLLGAARLLAQPSPSS
jgi:uncharacterized protein (DUF849 family)